MFIVIGFVTWKIPGNLNKWVWILNLIFQQTIIKYLTINPVINGGYCFEFYKNNKAIDN